MIPIASNPWRRTSASFVGAAALAAFMLFLGVRGLVAPLAAAKGFGLPVTDGADALWLQIKGGRDLCAGLGLVTFLALRNPRTAAAFLLTNVAIPVVDLTVSLSAPVHDAAYALPVHGGAAMFMVVLAVALLRAAGVQHPSKHLPVATS